MGRRSAFGLSFLVCRSDSGTFSYTRDVAPALQSFVSGEIELSWAGTRRAIGGGRVIKVALKTSDERIAKVRWAEVHPQIERLIATAEARVREQHRPVLKPVRISGLTDADIQVLTAQAHHDILSKHDEVTLNPGKLTPLEDILLRVGGSASADAMGDRQAARRLSHEIEARHAKSAARDASALNALNRPTAWKTGVILDSQDDTLTLAQLEPAFLGESDVGHLLARNGVELPVDHPDRRKLALSVARAQARAHRAVLERLNGNPINTPTRPDPLKPLGTASSDHTLTQAYERWRSLMKPAEHTANDYRVQVVRFVALHGDLAVVDIKRSHIRQFRDALELFPRNVPPSKSPSGKKLSLWSRL
jgi:hypothetical protein